MWHLARKCFERVHDGGFIELWQEDFALVVFRSGEKLLWTHPHRKLKQSWWERLEDSPQYDAYVPDAGSRERVQRNFEKLPPWNFNPPSYVPEQQLWRDAKPLEREAADSRWYCFFSLSLFSIGVDVAKGVILWLLILNVTPLFFVLKSCKSATASFLDSSGNPNSS